MERNENYYVHKYTKHGKETLTNSEMETQQNTLLYQYLN